MIAIVALLLFSAGHICCTMNLSKQRLSRVIWSQAHTPWLAGWWCFGVHCRGLASCPSWLACQRLCFSSFGQSTSQSCQRLYSFTLPSDSSYTAAVKTYRLNQVCMNGLMLEPVCGRAPHILRRRIGCCRCGGLMCGNSWCQQTLSRARGGTEWWSGTSWTGLDFRK